MISPLATVLISTIAAILATLLTIFLTPRLQHHFWKRQKREEIRLAVVTEITQLAAEFKTRYLLKDMGAPTTERLFASAQAWTSVEGQVKVIFSEPTYQAFEQLYIHVISAPLFSNQEIGDRLPRLREFEKIRDAAVQALYKEIGIL